MRESVCVRERERRRESACEVNRQAAVGPDGSHCLLGRVVPNPRERERECVCVCERETERESVCVCA